MKKLLFLGPPFEYYKGGAEYQYRILEEFLSNQYDIYYLFRHISGLQNQKYITYNYMFRNNYKEHLYTDALKIYQLIKVISPDIIYKKGINYITAVGVFYACKHSIPSIIHISSIRNIEKISILEHPSPTSILRKLIINYVVSNCKILVCQANYQADLLYENYRRQCDIIIPNFHHSPSHPCVKVKNSVNVVWIANFKNLKQPDIFIDIADRFLDVADVKFLMIGKPFTDSTQDYINKRIKLLPNLEYFGELSIETVNEILEKSHILINTSLYEGFPNTFIQAWMREVPVISLNCDPDNIIKNQQLGFHSKTFEQMIIDLKVLVNNKSLRNVMGKKAKIYATEQFSTKNIQKFVDLIDGI